MCPDGEQHLVNSNCFNLLGLGCPFDEALGMQIVMVLTNKMTCFSEQHQNINALFQLL